MVNHLSKNVENVLLCFLCIRVIRFNGDGSYLLFYSLRKKESHSKKSIKCKKTNSLYQEFAETLESMGLDCSEKDVTEALSELYPNGTKNIDQGLVIRELYRFLKGK